MSTISLDLLLIENHSPYALSIGDFSTYPTNYTPVSPTLMVVATGFPQVTLTFTPNQINTYTSENLGITCVGTPIERLPDGLYKVKYTINPAYQNFVEKTFLRVDAIQERFNKTFMQLDIMQCDGPIRKQRKEELSTINFYIQGAIAAANNCADEESLRLYNKANQMLDQFINQKCNCHAI